MLINSSISFNLERLENNLKRLKRISDSRNVKSQQVFTKGTPQAAIDKAVAELGQDNVIKFSDVTSEDFSELPQLKIIKDNINFNL